MNGVSQISQYYQETHGRKIIDESKNILDLLNHPKRIAQAVSMIVILAIVGLVFIIRVIVIRKKRKERRLIA